MWAEVQCVNGVYFGLKHQDINSTGVAPSQVILTESNSLPFYLLRFCHTVCQHVHCCCNSAYLSKARWLQSVFSGGSMRLCDKYHIYIRQPCMSMHQQAFLYVMMVCKFIVYRCHMLCIMYSMSFRSCWTATIFTPLGLCPEKEGLLLECPWQSRCCFKLQQLLCHLQLCKLIFAPRKCYLAPSDFSNKVLYQQNCVPGLSLFHFSLAFTTLPQTIHAYSKHPIHFR